MGYGDICPESDAERLYAIVAMVIGGAFYGYIIGNISSIVSSTDVNSRAYYERMDLIHTYMTIRKFPRKLRRKVGRPHAPPPPPHMSASASLLRRTRRYASSYSWFERHPSWFERHPPPSVPRPLDFLVMVNEFR